MIDEKIKKAWQYITVAYSGVHFVTITNAYIQAEARARMAEFWLESAKIRISIDDPRRKSALADWVKEVEAELSK